MIWIILAVVVVFLIATGMPLIRDQLNEKRRQEKLARHLPGEDEPPSH